MAKKKYTLSPKVKANMKKIQPAGLGVKSVVSRGARALMAKELGRHANTLKRVGGMRNNLSMGRAGDAARRLARRITK